MILKRNSSPSSAVTKSSILNNNDHMFTFGTANGQCLFAVPNQAENGKYNLISVWFNKISKKILCVQLHSVRKKYLVYMQIFSCVCAIPAYGSVRFPLCRYTLQSLTGIQLVSCLKKRLYIETAFGSAYSQNLHCHGFSIYYYMRWNVHRYN